MVKGNSGKAARIRLMTKLIFVIVCCATVIGIYEISRNRYLSEETATGEASIRKGLNSHRRKKINYKNLTSKEKVQLIESGRVHLINIRVGNEIEESEENDYQQVVGLFCELNWSVHKDNPSKFPMFRDVVKQSDCKHPIEMSLKQAVRYIKKADQSSKFPGSKTLEPSGFVFHESRCGSTLAANALAAMNPPKNRVYSESTPPIVALRACGLAGKDCPLGTAEALFRDVIYLMGRTDDVNERHLFFKIQSIGTKYIDIVMNSFPDTPWIFIYRNPVHVMMSQLEHGVRNANCVHQLRDVPEHRIEQLSARGLTIQSLSDEERCALHLSLLCESAVEGLKRSNRGKSVNYEGIIDNLIEHTIPDHFQILTTNEAHENILEIGSKYSKGRGDRERKFENDNKKKEEAASPAVKKASKIFLELYYDQLEEY